MRKKLFGIFALAGLISGMSALAAAQAVVYDSIPDPLPPNVVSEGFECCSTAELGDEVTLSGTARVAGSATVVMSSWAKHSDYPTMDSEGFHHPITFTLYGPSVPGSLSGQVVPGPVLGQVTQHFMLPWRPEHDPSCPGDAWKASNGNCYNGFATMITFDLRAVGPGGTHVLLPNKIVYGIAYDTSTHGYHPLGHSGPHDSLNVGLTTAVPSVGTDVDPTSVFQNTDSCYFTADCLLGINVFRRETGDSLDAAGWTGYTPAVVLETYAVPADKDDCKKDGWKSLVRADFTAFKNQGACEKYVKTGK